MLTPGLSLSGGAYIEQERFAQFHNPALNEEDATKLTFWENLKAYFNIGSSKEKKEFLNLLWKLHKLNCTDEDVVLELCREITDKVASGNTVKCNGKLVGGTYFYSLTVESDSEGIPVTIYDGYQRYLQNNPTYRDSSVKAGSESLRALENVNVPNILSFDDTFEKNHFTIEAQLRKLKGSLPEFCNAPYGGTNPIAGRQHVDVSASNESKQIAGVEMDSDPCEIDLNK